MNLIRKLFSLVFLVGILSANTNVEATPLAVTASKPYLGPFRILYNADNLNYRPRLAYNSARDEYMMVWENVLGSSFHAIYGARIDRNGNVITTFSIAESPNHNVMNPDIAYDSRHDQFLVVWSYDWYGDGSDLDIHGRFLPWDGPGTSQSEFDIDNSADTSDKPRVAYGYSQDKFLVAWRGDNIDVSANIEGKFVDENQFSNFWLINISSGAANNDRDDPDITYNLARNEWVVTYDVQFSANDRDVYAARINADGQPSAEVSIAISSLNEQHPAVVACNTADQYLFVWQQYTGSSTQDDIYGRFLTGGGTLYPITLVAAANTVQEFPAVDCSASGNEYLIAWANQNGSNFGIWSRVAYPNMYFDPSFGVVQPSPDRNFPAVAYGKSNALIAWQHYRDTSGSSPIELWGVAITLHPVFIPTLRK